VPNGYRARVEPIRGEPSPNGLLGGCTEVVIVRDPHELNGTDVPGISCAAAGTWDNCPDPLFPNPDFKTFDRPINCEFDPITLYVGVECSTFGLTQEEMQDRALEGLRLGEQRALEEWFQSRWLCTNAAGNDLTPAAGALSIAQGIGALEGWLATNYGGQGVIHAPAGAGALMSHSKVVTCGCDEPPRTLMGNCVVLGAGYMANLGPADPGPGCEVAPAGEAWLYITPPVRIRRDERSLTLTREALAVNTSINDRRSLAETTAVVEVACCMAAAVRVSLNDCP
jgi:hypothetical protein